MKTSLLLASIFFVSLSFAEVPRGEVSLGGYYSFDFGLLEIEAKLGRFLTKNHGLEIALSSIIFRTGNHFYVEMMVNHLYNLPHHKATPYVFIEAGGNLFDAFTSHLLNTGVGLRFHLTDTANIRGQFVIKRYLETGYTRKYISTGISVYLR